MKRYFLALVATLLFGSLGVAQDVHSDIEFGYDDFNAPQSIVIESDELTSDGIQITEGEFEDSLGDVFAENPGFITAADEGLRVNADDRITVRFLNASEETAVGVGFVNYYDPATGQLEPGVGQIEIGNQAGSTTTLNGASVTGSPNLLLSLGSDGNLLSNPGEEGEKPEPLPEGEIHNHLLFDLQGTEAEGAYGILFQFEADFADENGDTDGTIDVTSEPIWLIFNNGMDDEVFEEEAVAAFSPEEEEGHSDIEFGYDDASNPQSIVVESDEFTLEGIQITEGEFEDALGDVFAENPGFITAADEGLRVNADDRITVRFLNASEETAAGVGFVNYYDPATGRLEPGVGQIQIGNQAGSSTTLNSASIAGDESLFLSLGSDGNLLSNPGEEGEEPELLPEGEIHNHLVFDLQGTEDTGAYGILFQFEADFADANGETDGTIDATSEPIWLILNNGMDDEVFEEEAVPAFGLLLGDINGDGEVNFLDIRPFILLLSSSVFQAEADFDKSGEVNFLDIVPFIQALSAS